MKKLSHVTHPDKDVERELNILVDIYNDEKLPKSIKREKIRQARLSLRNRGILSLPFSLNPKKNQ